MKRESLGKPAVRDSETAYGLTVLAYAERGGQLLGRVESARWLERTEAQAFPGMWQGEQDVQNVFVGKLDSALLRRLLTSRGQPLRVHITFQHQGELLCADAEVHRTDKDAELICIEGSLPKAA